MMTSIKDCFSQCFNWISPTTQNSAPVPGQGGMAQTLPQPIRLEIPPNKMVQKPLSKAPAQFLTELQIQPKHLEQRLFCRELDKVHSIVSNPQTTNRTKNHQLHSLAHQLFAPCTGSKTAAKNISYQLLIRIFYCSNPDPKDVACLLLHCLGQKIDGELSINEEVPSFEKEFENTKLVPISSFPPDMDIFIFCGSGKLAIKHLVAEQQDLIQEDVLGNKKIPLLPSKKPSPPTSPKNERSPRESSLDRSSQQDISGELSPMPMQNATLPVLLEVASSDDILAEKSYYTAVENAVNRAADFDFPTVLTGKITVKHLEGAEVYRDHRGNLATRGSQIHLDSSRLHIESLDARNNNYVHKKLTERYPAILLERINELSQLYTNKQINQFKEYLNEWNHLTDQPSSQKTIKKTL